jgi:hypothetical protein
LDSLALRSHEDVLDEIYAKYAQSDPFLRPIHFANHATMGAEALTELGLGHRVSEWVSHHPARAYLPPRTGTSIVSSWMNALGREECYGDWLNDLEIQLGERPYEEVLARWVPRFAHDVGTLLFHGLIRTAHAVRALDHRDTLERRGELARGLALWAIGVRSPPPSGPAHDVEEIEIVNYARFGAATLVDMPSVPAVHLVTGPMAYRLIAHHLDAKTHLIASQSFARTHAGAMRRFDALKSKARMESFVIDERHENAIVDSRDAHPAKLTEAALRAFRETDDSIFLGAARQALHLHGVQGAFGIMKAMIRRSVE